MKKDELMPGRWYWVQVGTRVFPAICDPYTPGGWSNFDKKNFGHLVKQYQVIEPPKFDPKRRTE